MKLEKLNYKFYIGMMIGLMISFIGIYVYTLKSSSNNVFAATSGTCSNASTIYNTIKEESQVVTYSSPFKTLPSGYSATAYKLNGIVVLTIKVPTGVSGWIDSSNNYSLISELCSNNYVSAKYRYSSSADINNMFYSIGEDCTLYGLVNVALNSVAYAQFVYPIES